MNIWQPQSKDSIIQHLQEKLSTYARNAEHITPAQQKLQQLQKECAKLHTKEINLKAELQSKLHSSEQTLEDVKREFNQLSVEVQEKLLVLSDHQEQIVVARDKRAMMEEHVEELKIGHRELQDEGEALIKEHSRLESNKQGWDRQLQELNSETMNLEQDKLVVLQKGLAIERDINSLRIAIEKNTHIIQCYKGECESIRHDTQDIEAEEKELSQKIIELKEQANHLELQEVSLSERIPQLVICLERTLLETKIEKEKLQQSVHAHNDRKNHIKELMGHIHIEKSHTNTILSANGNIGNVNERLSRDLIMCKQHLASLITNNKMLKDALQQFEKQDESIVEYLSSKRQEAGRRTMTRTNSCISVKTGVF